MGMVTDSYIIFGAGDLLQDPDLSVKSVKIYHLLVEGFVKFYLAPMFTLSVPVYPEPVQH